MQCFIGLSQIVVSNADEIHKVKLISTLRKEFWEYPRFVGWRIPSDKLERSPSNSSVQNDSKNKNNNNHILPTDVMNANQDTEDNQVNQTPVTPNCVVPSEAVNGNFLEAINTTLNLLGKHYMDRLVSSNCTSTL